MPKKVKYLPFKFAVTSVLFYETVINLIKFPDERFFILGIISSLVLGLAIGQIIEEFNG